ncbi:MAG: M23 family metallopeptidase [Acidobacteriota bacterium]
MSKGNFTVIIARFAETTCRKYTIPHKTVVSFGIVSLILIALFTLSSLHYYHMWKKTSDFSRLKVEADQLLKENVTFRVTTQQLAEKVSALEVASTKLRIFSGLDREGLGGVGGPSRLDAQIFTLSNQDLYRHLKSLDKRSISLEKELQDLNAYYNSRMMLLTATPALMPVRGYPSDRFGWRIDPFSGKRDFHSGIDISAPHGNKVIATADAVVSFAGSRYAYGKMVTLEHKFGISTRYGHMTRTAVVTGQTVKKGDIIGYVGSTGRATGPHLHYEVRLNGQALNPLSFFREQN